MTKILSPIGTHYRALLLAAGVLVLLLVPSIAQASYRYRPRPVFVRTWHWGRCTAIVTHGTNPGPLDIAVVCVPGGWRWEWNHGQGRGVG